ncbi:MAG: serine/threonine protein kinase [Roseiflexus sp.]|nr:serine/threonine protein kinase [Roseiflexus sp.]MCS7290170.1 serine/threonine protein kinase [Roseiflexus sp.]MDW8148781.1 serine/threonine-protein kinase [Roseiflexaceae bacterium]MDW8232607.1 serine/threonine-protein kinase [Roseiflexaceae bacterium]
MQCPVCNALNPDGAPFCAECGIRLAGAAMPSVAMATGALPQQFILQGRYVIEQKLGQGGMGAVYRARDLRLSTVTWAIKEMSQAQITGPLELQEARAAFQREAELLASLSHPGLPKVVDHFEQDGKAYLVMEFVPGDSLLTIAQREGLPFPLPRVLDWARQICEVLEYLHNRPTPIIFRDLKPANVMLTPEGRIKLVDFGIARIFKPGKERDTQAFGTLGYSAPEQYGRSQTDPRADIYSLGVLLHQLLTGYDPTSTPFRLPSANQINPAIPQHVSDAIARAVDPDPNRRFPNVRAFYQALTGQQQIMLQAGTPTEAVYPRMSVSGSVGQTMPISPPISGSVAAQPPPVPLPTTGLANAGRWIGIGSMLVMGFAAILVAISAATTGTDSELAGVGYLIAFLPLATGPLAFLLGLIALLSSATQQTVRGRQHAIVGIVTGLMTGLLCCGIFVLVGGSSS